MANTNHKIVADNLEPLDIYIKGSALTLNDSYDPKNANNPMLSYQTRWTVKKIESFKISDGGNDTLVLRVLSQGGIRLISASEVKALPKDATIENNEHIKAELVTKFIAEYTIKKNELPEDGVTAYANQSARFHVWPFWREHILSSFEKAVLPRVTIPVFSMKK